MGAASKPAGAKRGQREALGDVADQVLRLHLEAVESILPAKVEQTLRHWFARVEFDGSEAEGLRTTAVVLSLALALEAATPSHSGATAYDRLARRRALSREEQAAVAALRAARYTPFLLRSRRDACLYDAQDLGTGQGFVLFAEDWPAGLEGRPLFAQLFPLQDGTFGSTGLETLLDQRALEVALGFVRPGRGIPHSHRCAAAVYRHLARNGGPVVPTLDEALAEDAEPTELDRLAERFEAREAAREPTAGILDEARRLVSADTILEALFKAVQSGRFGTPRLGLAYRGFAEVMIEALHLRALAGSGTDRTPLDGIAAIIADEHATNDYPSAAAALFRDICLTLTASKAREAGPDLTRIVERIRGLRAKTVDQGCTEEEALAAADKVAELLDRYGLSLGETDLRDQACVGVGIESRRKRSGPLDDTFPAIAHFCDCRSWQERAADDTIRSVFFGLPADVEAAQYLYERVAAALDTETAAFRKGKLYAGLASGGRQKATTSFQLGLVRGIGAKLDARKVERDTKTFAATGRDLVPVKVAVVEEELAKLGMAFTYKEVSRGRIVLRDAFEAGRVASGRFEIQSELEQSRGPAAGRHPDGPAR